MIDLIYLIQDFFKSKSIQDFINRRFKDNTKIILDKSGIFKIIGTESGLFYLDDMYITIEQAAKDYDISDLRPSDMVLDIGACIGGFCVPVASGAKLVYAIEPALTERLQKNINLNKRLNVGVYPWALGEGVVNINWAGIKTQCIGLSLTEIIKRCGGQIDFLKCDCEGGEWCIRPEELKGIRKIEIEVHDFDGKHHYSKFLNILDEAKFIWSIIVINDKIALIHAKSTEIK